MAYLVSPGGFYHAAGVAGGDGVGGDVAYDYAARAYHAVVADGDAGTYYHSAADPDVVADSDGLGPLGAGVAGLGVEWMAGREDAHVGAFMSV